MSPRPAATSRPLAARRSLLLARAGLAAAAIGIVGFFASYGDVTSPAVASAEVRGVPWLAWGSIFTWCAGMSVAVLGRWRVRKVMKAAERRREATAVGGVE